MKRVVGLGLLDACFVCLGAFAVDDCFNPTLAILFALWAVVMTVCHLDVVSRQQDTVRRRSWFELGE